MYLRVKKRLKKNTKIKASNNTTAAKQTYSGYTTEGKKAVTATKKTGKEISKNVHLAQAPHPHSGNRQEARTQSHIFQVCLLRKDQCKKPERPYRLQLRLVRIPEKPVLYQLEKIWLLVSHLVSMPGLRS